MHEQVLFENGKAEPLNLREGVDIELDDQSPQLVKLILEPLFDLHVGIVVRHILR